MKVRVHTKSGSVYGFDSNKMTWTRVNLETGHRDITGYDHNQGELKEWPTFTIGESLYFYPKDANTYIRTTPVVLLHLVDY